MHPSVCAFSRSVFTRIQIRTYLTAVISGLEQARGLYRNGLVWISDISEKVKEVERCLFELHSMLQCRDNY